MTVKDREVIYRLAEAGRILWLRSSARPIEYAVLLQVRASGDWQTVFSADNSHRDLHVDEHHCHRYIGGEQQSAEPLPFAVAGTNDAMSKILDWFRRDWRKLR